MIDVDESDGKTLACTACALEFVVELLLDSAAVEHTGEQVPLGFVFDEGEEIAAEHQQKREADKEGKRDAEQDRDGLQSIPLSLVWRGAVHQQEEDAVQREDGIGGHEEGEDLQEHPVGCLAEDLDSDNAADEEEADGDDVDECFGVIVREDKVGDYGGRNDGERPCVANPAWAFEEVKNTVVEENKCGEQKTVGECYGKEGGEGAGQRQEDVGDGCRQERDGY